MTPLRQRVPTRARAHSRPVMPRAAPLSVENSRALGCSLSALYLFSFSAALLSLAVPFFNKSRPSYLRSRPGERIISQEPATFSPPPRKVSLTARACAPVGRLKVAGRPAFGSRKRVPATHMNCGGQGRRDICLGASLISRGRRGSGGLHTRALPGEQELRPAGLCRMSIGQGKRGAH